MSIVRRRVLSGYHQSSRPLTHRHFLRHGSAPIPNLQLECARKRYVVGGTGSRPPAPPERQRRSRQSASFRAPHLPPQIEASAINIRPNTAGRTRIVGSTERAHAKSVSASRGSLRAIASSEHLTWVSARTSRLREAVTGRSDTASRTGNISLER